MKRNKTEYIIGFALLALALILGVTSLPSPALVSRLIIGLGIGYVLARSFYGFAGTANRAFNAGSTKLMRAFMFLVVLASFVTVFFAAVPASDVNPEFVVKYGHFINPINLALIIGAIVFGIGMAFAGGCASGVLTDLSSVFPKALLGLIFFGIGGYIAKPLVGKLPESFVANSLVKSSEEINGVWFPDLFKGDGLNGFLGAMILTIVLALIVVKIAYSYENKRKAAGTYSPVESEEESINELVHLTEENSTWYERVFTRPWTLWEGAIGIAIMYAALMGFTKGAWGVSGPFSFWIGKIVALFIGQEAVNTYMGNPEFLKATIFTSPVSLQDIGIIVGAFVALLTMGRFTKPFKEGLKITGRQALLAIIGGFLMGVGAILAKGCNAGGLFSPLVSFSLSGWVYLVFMVLGSYIGNKISNSSK